MTSKKVTAVNANRITLMCRRLQTFPEGPVENVGFQNLISIWR